MSMESFYGGRPGESCAIVKRFDGIDIPEGTLFKSNYYAGKKIKNVLYYIVDAENHLIPKNADNVKLHKYRWYPLEHNNTEILKTVNEEDGLVEGVANHIEYAEGMVQCFKKGSETLSEVNYGQYVLIDTVSNRYSYNDIDNGKIFRRGLNYDNDLGGAEYIGWVGGPKGETPEIHLSSEEKIKQEYNEYEAGTYTKTNNELIPGKYITPDGEVKYNDDLTYAYAPVKNSSEKIEGAVFGFTAPYLVQDFTSETIDAYSESSITETDDKTHPYYQSWIIKVPKGKQGNAISDFKFLIETISPEGVKTYSEYTEGTVLQENQRIVLSYNEIDYSTSGEGIKHLHILGEYQSIKDVELDKEGQLSVTYNNGKIDNMSEKIQWIKSATLNTDNGELQLISNIPDLEPILNTKLDWVKNVKIIKESTTLEKPEGATNLIFEKTVSDNFSTDINHVQKAELENQDIIFTYSSGAKRRYPGVIKSISKVEVDKDENLLITFVGEQEAVNVGTIRSIKDVQMMEDGTLTFIYNKAIITPSGESITEVTFPKKIKWVNAIERGLVGNIFTDEIFVTYNNDKQKHSLGTVDPALIKFANKEMTREEFEAKKPDPSIYAQVVVNEDQSKEVYVYGQQSNSAEPARWYSIGTLKASTNPDDIIIDELLKLNLTNKLIAIDNKDTEQDNSINEIKQKDTEQDQSINEIKQKDTEQDQSLDNIKKEQSNFAEISVEDIELLFI